MIQRQERVNMIDFLSRLTDLKAEQFIYMTDEDIEHIYETTYFHHEEIVE